MNIERTQNALLKKELNELGIYAVEILHPEFDDSYTLQLTDGRLVGFDRTGFCGDGLNSTLDQGSLQEAVVWSMPKKFTTPGFGIIMTGGSIGDTPEKDRTATYVGTEEEAKAKAKRMNKRLSPGEKKVYRIKYKVVKLEI